MANAYLSFFCSCVLLFQNRVVEETVDHFLCSSTERSRVFRGTIVLVRCFGVHMFLVFRQRLKRLVFCLGLICGGLTRSSEFCHQAGSSSLEKIHTHGFM